MKFDETTQKNIDAWLNGNYDLETKKEVKKLVEEHPEKAQDAFYTRMAFGTGGLRGIMGPGTNRMNQHTIGAATQGLANYINLQASKTPPSVLIGHDSRHNSAYFTEIAAKIFAANNIRVYMYEKLRPVPMVSFGCRHKKCQAAVMITASHNPPEYNGYKVYWEDGAQVLPPHDEGIIKEVYKIENPDQIKSLDSLDSPLIHTIKENLDHSYLDIVRTLQHYPDDNKQKGDQLKVVYTPIHGSGITMVPKILADWGFSSTSLVQEQATLDGDFPTVEKPNPEEQKAMQMGINQLLKENADILIGTDPDCDRIGAAVLHKCKAALLTGNEIASLCTYHICEALTQQNKMPQNGAFIKTIVTTELIPEIAKRYEKPCFNVLTGFKYIGQLIKEWKQTSPSKYEYLFGGEESYGYLLGTHSRDKDAIIMAALICEVAHHAKLNGKTLIDLLEEIYEKFGVFRERLTSLVYPDTKETKDNIKNMMQNLRDSPPKAFGSTKVTSMEDYQSSKKKDLVSGEETNIGLPKSNVLLFWLEDGSKLVVRPSGTEPKVKIYCGVMSHEKQEVSNQIAKLDQKTEQLTKDLQELIS